MEGSAVTQALLWLLATLALVPATVEDDRVNAQANCPYCGGDPERMAAAGIASHGGFEFGTSKTEGVDQLLITSDIRWIESAHYEIGIALGPYRPSQDERKPLRAELERLALTLPEVNPKAKVIDPWLRVHLYAQRLEETWQRFLEIMQVEEKDFPDGKRNWIIGTKYMGEGPYLGQKGKYEILIVPSEAVHVSFLRDQFGLSIKKTQRWNVVERDTMTVTIHTQEDTLRRDAGLHAHTVFNVAQNMLDGYKHYSYDTPRWISEGLSHFMEREVNPRFNSFDSSEGAVAETTRKSEWTSEVRKLIQGDDAPRMAELINLRTFAEFELEHHFATWSITKFLIEEHPDWYACLNDRLHGVKNGQGYPDGSDMNGKHRDAFKECMGMGYPQFDDAWRAWALAQE